MKLAAELARPDTGRTLYVLDEPTTGLHFDDIAKLLDVLHRLVDLGNTVARDRAQPRRHQAVRLDHRHRPRSGRGRRQRRRRRERRSSSSSNLRLRKAEGGKRKARSREANPKSAFRTPQSAFVSHTAPALAPILAAGPHVERKPYDFAAAEANAQGDLDIADLGREVKMPWETNGRKWHVEDRTARSGAARAAGTAASSPRSTSASTSEGGDELLLAHRLVQPHDRRNRRRQEKRRLVLPRHHRRALARASSSSAPPSAPSTATSSPRSSPSSRSTTSPRSKPTATARA